MLAAGLALGSQHGSKPLDAFMLGLTSNLGPWYCDERILAYSPALRLMCSRTLACLSSNVLLARFSLDPPRCRTWSIWQT